MADLYDLMPDYEVLLELHPEEVAGLIYDTAVSQAFKEIEIAVRAAGGFDAAAFGTSLMGDAFKSDGNLGPLQDPQLPSAERSGLRNLFAGAYAYYRNPTAHRKVGMGAEEAIEVLMFASRLMKIVDESVAGKP